MGFWIRKDEVKDKTKSKKKKAPKKAPVAKKTEVVCYKGLCTSLDILEAELAEFRDSARSKKDLVLLQKLEERVFEIYEAL